MSKANSVRSLADLMAEEGLLSLARTVDLANQIVEATRTASGRARRVDRLEPRAVRLAPNDPSGTTRPRVTGLARARSLPAFDRVSASYRAPELQGNPTAKADQAAQQFALAAIVYEMLAGCTPFPEDEEDRRAGGPGDRPAPPISELVVGIPGGLDAILGRALAAQPGARFSRTEDFVAALREIADPAAVWDDGPTVIWSPDAGYWPGFEPRTSQPASRGPSRRMQLSFVAAALVLLIGAVLVMSGSRQTAPADKPVTGRADEVPPRRGAPHRPGPPAR